MPIASYQTFCRDYTTNYDLRGIIEGTLWLEEVVGLEHEAGSVIYSNIKSQVGFNFGIVYMIITQYSN